MFATSSTVAPGLCSVASMLLDNARIVEDARAMVPAAYLREGAVTVGHIGAGIGVQIVAVAPLRDVDGAEIGIMRLGEGRRADHARDCCCGSKKRHFHFQLHYTEPPACLPYGLSDALAYSNKTRLRTATKRERLVRKGSLRSLEVQAGFGFADGARLAGRR